MIDFVLNVCSWQHFIFSLCSFSVCSCYFEYLFTIGYLKKERRGKGKNQIRILLNCWLLFHPIFWVWNDIALFGIREREKKSSKLYHYFTTGLHWPKETQIETEEILKHRMKINLVFTLHRFDFEWICCRLWVPWLYIMEMRLGRPDMS